jgi:trimethylamine monooxygenase
MNKRIAIIGAGPSGMAQLRAFESARAKSVDVPEVVCFEKQRDWGGQWNYTWRTGLDEYGEPVHSSMYRHLWSNAPKECLEFAEYTFDEHFGHPVSSYPPRQVLWDYIQGRALQSNVRQYVRFETSVRTVQYLAAEDAFAVTSVHLPTGEATTDLYTEVVVANGHFSTPNMPAFAGIETFPGRICHAHDFRGAEDLGGMDVLLIGSSYSAEDIGIQAHKMGARSVTFSYRTRPMGFGWPEGARELPLVQRFEGRRAFFANGESHEFDAVFLCTGYKHHFPFLPSDLALKTQNSLYPDNLYKGVVSEANQRLFFLGMQDQWFTFNMFDAQAWYVRDVILGQASLPAPHQRRGEIDTWRKRQESLSGDKDEIQFQADYIKDLIEATDYPMFDLEEVVDTFRAWQEDKKADILRYRDVCYRSIMTGTLATPHHTRWLDAMDDSFDNYLRPALANEAPY